MSKNQNLSRRERQIMDILFAQGEATVNAIHDGLPDPPAHTAVRTFLKLLIDKGHVKRRKTGREYVYQPRVRRTPAGRDAMRRVLDIFFDGSLEKALAAHLDDPRRELSNDELQRIRQLINEARRRGQ